MYLIVKNIFNITCALISSATTYFETNFFFLNTYSPLWDCSASFYFNLNCDQTTLKPFFLKKNRKQRKFLTFLLCLLLNLVFVCYLFIFTTRAILMGIIYFIFICLMTSILEHFVMFLLVIVYLLWRNI